MTPGATARIGLLAAIAMTALGTFLPFARSGERTRSSYQLVAVARRLEVVPDGWPSAATRLWFAVPLLLAVCWLLAVTGRDVVGAVFALVVSTLALTAVVVVWRSPLGLAPGWTVTAVGACALSSCAATALIARTRGGP